MDLSEPSYVDIESASFYTRSFLIRYRQEQVVCVLLVVSLAEDNILTFFIDFSNMFTSTLIPNLSL